ncbi:MAG: GNAT family N-acetyltransferase [Bacteroidales bacterium]|nr:GNAT family N-acetyltransferase [Bacteroidales bacterium]
MIIVQTQNKTLLKVQEDAISAFLSTQPCNTIFQSPDFYHFYLSVKNFTPYYFLLYDDNEVIGVMLAVIIRETKGLFSVIGSRCVVYGGPIVQKDNPEHLSKLLNSLNTSISRLTVLTQFRNFRIWNKESISVFKNNGFIFHDHLNLVIENQESEATLSGMNPSRRRQLRKGLQSGAILKPAANITEVKELYDILYTLYRKKVRKPLPKWPFFEQFYNEIVKSGKGIILLVHYNDKIIGGIVSPVTPGKTIYELYICGLDKEYPQQHPSVLATWAALDWAAKNNIPEFDFLGLGKPEIPYGVRNFKLRFGGEQVNYGRFGRRNYNIMYFIAELGYNILRKFNRV